MIHYQKNMPQSMEHEPAGGKGDMTFRTLFAPEDLAGKTGMFAAVTLPAGNTIGEHLHDSDCEVYYILSGEGVMIEDGKRYPVQAGDVEFCPQGHSHGLDNLSAEPVTFLAMQLKY